MRLPVVVVRRSTRTCTENSAEYRSEKRGDVVGRAVLSVGFVGQDDAFVGLVRELLEPICTQLAAFNSTYSNSQRLSLVA